MGALDSFLHWWDDRAWHQLHQLALYLYILHFEFAVAATPQRTKSGDDHRSLPAPVIYNTGVAAITFQFDAGNYIQHLTCQPLSIVVGIKIKHSQHEQTYTSAIEQAQ